MTQLKKIVLVINSLQGGGAEKFVLTLGEAFFHLGFEVHVVRFDPKVEHHLSPHLHYHLLSYKNYKWAKRGRLRNFVFAKAVDRYIRQQIGQTAMILVNLYRAYEVFYYSKLPNVAYIIHNNLSDKLQLNTLDPKQLAYYQKVYTSHPCVAVSEGVKKDYINHFGDTNRIISILNPIDAIGIRRLADQFSVPLTDYLVHVGSFKAQKGHEILLEAYAKSSQRKSLVLVGQGGLQQQIEAKIQVLGLQDKVTLVGFQPNPYPYIKNSHGFVLSSHFEGFALVVAEALALEIPAISTDCPSGPNEILPPQNLVPVADVAALSEKMNQLMDNPVSFKVAFNTAFLPESVARQYLDFMQVAVSS